MSYFKQAMQDLSKQTLAHLQSGIVSRNSMLARLPYWDHEIEAKQAENAGNGNAMHMNKESLAKAKQTAGVLIGKMR